MDIITIEWQHILVVIVGFIAGFFGVLVGGGSFLTIPTLILVGLPPHIAIATNRVGLIGMVCSGGIQYHRQRLIDYKIGFFIGGIALLGSIFGAHLMLVLNEDVLKHAIAVLSAMLLIIILIQSEKGLVQHKKKIRKREYVLGGVISFFLGAYGGFYGAGTATLLSYLLVMMFGKTFLESTGTNKIAMFLLSAVAAFIFIRNGVVDYYYAFLVFISMAVGGFISARHAKTIGNKWLKRMFIGVALVMVVMLFHS